MSDSILEDVDDLETLSSEDDKVEESSEEEVVEEKGEVEEEEEEKEESEEEEKEEKVEEEDTSSTYPRPRISEIKAKYPDFFKTFPTIRDAIIREAKYTEQFPTLEDAQEAKEKAETFDVIQQDVFSGNPGNLISAVKQLDNKAAERFVDNFIPQLYQVDESLYFRLVTPVVQRFVKAMYEKGEKSQNKNLVNSALHAMQFADFDESIFQNNNGRGRVDPELENEKRQVAEERNRIHAERYQAAYSSVASTITQEIDKELDNLVALEKGLKPLERRALKKEIKEAFDKTIGNDKKHLQLMDSLWAKAQKASYNREWTERITTAYLSRAKAILPGVRSKVRKELFGEKVSPAKVEEKVETKQEKSTSRTSTKPQRFKSDLEILMED